MTRRVRISVVRLCLVPIIRIYPRAAKRPARGLRVSGPFRILVCVSLSRRTGHSRQHAMRMVMVVPAMLQRNAHLLIAYRPPALLVNAEPRSANPLPHSPHDRSPAPRAVAATGPCAYPIPAPPQSDKPTPPKLAQPAFWRFTKKPLCMDPCKGVPSAFFLLSSSPPPATSPSPAVSR